MLRQAQTVPPSTLENSSLKQITTASTLLAVHCSQNRFTISPYTKYGVEKAVLYSIYSICSPVFVFRYVDVSETWWLVLQANV
jgi:hypothetical protein